MTTNDTTQNLNLPATVGDFALMSAPLAELRETLLTNLGGRTLELKDLDTVKLQGGGSIEFAVPSPEGETTKTAIEGVIVGYSPTRRRWSAQFGSTFGKSDLLCASQDGITGVGDPGGPCERCDLRLWGEDGERPICGERRAVYVLQRDDILPILLDLPGSSVRAHGAKHPLPVDGHLAATTDDRQLVLWGLRWPTANVGISCPASKVCVIDIDIRSDGDTSLAELERTHGELPPTWSVTTGNGAHYYYAEPPFPTRDVPIAAGIDFKRSGYTVCPPSVHPNGRQYAWLIGFAPDDLPLGTLPDWILERLTRDDGTATGSAAYSANGPAGDIEDSHLVAAFKARGWFYKVVRGRAVVKCPWRHTHTSGRDGDSSTIIFAPTTAGAPGFFKCSHSHCTHRQQSDVWLALLQAEVRA